jgi:hypothetical protein
MTEFIKPILIAAIPSFLLSFCLVYWAIQSGFIDENDNSYNLKKFKKEYDKNKSAHRVNRFHAKWLFFGGGYYGLMAFVTYIYVEFIEVLSFFKNYVSFEVFLEQISFAEVIKLIIDSFLNFIPAFTWFLYWPDQIVMQTPLYWLLASYLGYQLGSNCAKKWSLRK